VRQKGKITNWNAERGFGFVTPVGGGARVFLHVTAIAGRGRPPVEGDIVTYELAFDEKKRLRAVGVKWSVSSQPKVRPASSPTSSSAPLVVASLFVFFVIMATAWGALPGAVIVTYCVVSILTFLAYRWDKSAARKGQWRTKESSLLLLGLAGGWPGAVVAQKVFRHKTRKVSFQVAFWGSVVVNGVAVGWLLTGEGSQALHRLLN
jgi:uncharacterized membrane protein YsdA (DUF1294 family)/cold shock CspA family protein